MTKRLVLFPARGLLIFALSFGPAGGKAAEIPLGTVQPQPVPISLAIPQQPVTQEQPQLFAVRLSIFKNILDRKMAGAAPEAAAQVSPVRRMIEDILDRSGTSAPPDATLSRDTDSLLAAIASNPLLALAYAEALQPPDRKILATIRPGRGHGAAYRKNERLRFELTAAHDCYVQVLFLAPQIGADRGQILSPLPIFPREGKTSTRITAGQKIILGGSGEFTVQPPYGTDLVLLVASEQELQLPTPLGQMSFSSPFHFDRVLATMYGAEAAKKLSIDSTFFVTLPLENTPGGTRITLLSEEEAASCRLEEEEWNRPPQRYRSLPAGPIIDVRYPTLAEEENPTLETETPITLTIAFEKNRAPVDMSSLEVTAKKGFLSLSITDRIRKYLQGTVLDARKVDFPRGRFRIEVAIADVNGTRTSREYRLEVH